MQTLSTRLDHKRAANLMSLWADPAPTPLLERAYTPWTVLIKDETARMGLGAFKALGGIYAVANLCLGADAPRDVSLETIGTAAKGKTFVCASAGNHGMAVARGAKIFGAASRIHLSDTVPESFVARLEAEGATVIRSGATYEESIEAAIKDADSHGFIHLADGSWPGYTEPPRLVMEGYTVLAEEMRAVFEVSGDWPTHVFLQAGVGGMAAAIAQMIRANWAVQPMIIVVEPEAAPCLDEAVKAGRVVDVIGPVSNMGRLDCKTASMLAFEILRETADNYIQITDEEAQTAADVLEKLDVSKTTPSGAAGFAALRQMALPVSARPLIVVSEGAVT
ncbi:pyridoxal-phosphate dependent enzyme [Roseibium alexandrii]|uniref:Putative diaminopropionate ammonia-lyase n=1 Tax=Roseibium alexandrii TaxID=388408 RepID=A0A0M7AQU9_9HYPH|nr:pyridoxal-phosphate dependent enzyme [Roseibium alexandrii]CTQ77508.1 Putative diaminopropionate ammonia-lyase [Roseibium alexandrii]